MLGGGIGLRLCENRRGEVVAGVVQLEWRRVVRDGSRQRLFLLFELLEPHMGRLDADVVLLEFLENLMIPAPVMVELLEILLILPVPGGEDLLLPLDVVALLLAELSRRLRARPAGIGDESREGEREAEASEDAPVR